MKTRIFLGLLVLLVVGAFLFDWNWLRPALQNYLAEKSGRAVQIDDLHVSLDWTLEPTLRVRGLKVANTSWAAGQRPLVVAGEAAFTFSWQTVVERRLVFSLLKIVDAQVDLQRQADGLRNWRLTRPDDRRPGRVRVHALEAVNSSIHFTHQGLPLELHIASSPLPAELPSAIEDSPLHSHLSFNGRYRGEAFSGELETSAVLTFQDTGVPFALRGFVTSGQTRGEIDGTVADLFKFAVIDARVKLSGPSLAALNALTDAEWPETAGYDLNAQLNKAPTHYAFTKARAKVGGSDLSGELSVDVANERHAWQGALKSARMDLVDLGLWTKPSTETPRRFSDRPWGLARLQGFDAHLAWQIDQFNVPALPPVQSVQFTAALDNGVLDLTPLDLGLADGHAKGSLVIDAREPVPAVRTKLEWSALQVEQLMPVFPDKARLVGSLQGEARLSGRGDSLADVMGNANGTLVVSTRDASLSRQLDAKLGLNVGKFLGTLFRDDKQVPVRCAALTLDLRNGSGKVRRLLIDTEQTHVEGSGNIHLRDERFDLLLVPQAKKAGQMTLRQSIRVRGSLRDADFDLVEGNEPSRAGGCGP